MDSLHLGDHPVDPPVVLAPMAGVTNRAFRRLCREYGAGLYVSEMVTSRALVERNDKTMDLVRFHPSESPRSVQLYGVDPAVMSEAVRIVVGEDLADHIDLNFGCPVPKVTRKGGGAALPWKTDLFQAIVSAAVRAAAGTVPVTVKMRKGVDADHLTYLDAGRLAAQAGVSWVALHGRTASQFYSGQADWDAIARLKEELAALDTPVLGNGDIWTAADAMRMTAQTGCDGVVVGRGCLGRPWLFGQLAAGFAGDPIPADPDLTEVLRVYRRHAEFLVAEFGEEVGCREIRKHHAWYLKGFRVPSHVRRGLGLVQSLSDIDTLLAEIDADQPWPGDADGPRGRTGTERRPALPDRWLDSRTIDDAGRSVLGAAEIGVGGG